MNEHALDRKQVGAWAMFDFANSSYSAVVTTAVFPVFYATYVVAGDGGAADGVGEIWLGWADALAAFIVAVSVPLLGAVADRGGGRKKFMLFYTLVCVAAVAAMTTLTPGMALWGLVVFVVAQVGFESAVVFYNAYLPDLAPPERQGWVSGLGFGVGYFGSAVALVLALQIRDRIDAVWLMVAGFFLLFSMPAFLLLPRDRPGAMSIGAAARWGVGNFRAIVGEVWAHVQLRRFLFAYFFYIDAILTIIVFAGVVATRTFGFDQQGTIVLFLIVQLSALAGAFALAKPTDLVGPKKVLTGVLILWIATCVSVYFIRSPRLFYVMAVVGGLGLGSAQSASRAFMASLVPRGRESEMFGFYALCGKSSSIFGPLIFGATTYLAGGNQRPAFLAIAALFVVGLWLLQRVNDPKAVAREAVPA